MRALHLTRDFPPRGGGGISTATGAAVAGLASAGLETSVISLDRGGQASAGERLLRITGADGAAAAERWGARWRPDVVHVHDARLWELGASIANEAGAAACFTAHVLAFHQDRLRGLERATLTARAEKAALAEAAAVIAPSEGARALIAGERGARDRLVTLPLALPDPGPPPSPAPADRPPRLLFAARFSDMAGIEELAGLLGPLAERCPGAQLMVAGGLPANPRAEARWRRRLEKDAAAARLPLELLGWLEPPALDAAYRDADVLLAPARFATFGLGILEAMLRAVPVVATPTAGHRELIEDGRTGHLCPAGEMAAAVAELAADPETRGRLGTAARARALERFDPGSRTAALIALYRRLAGGAQ